MRNYATAVNFQGFWKPAQSEGSLVLINSLKLFENLKEEMGLKPHPRADQSKPNPGIIAEVIVFGKGRPEVLGRVMITTGNLVKELRKHVGEIFIGVPKKIVKPDNTEYWIFEPFTPDQAQTIDKFLDEHPGAITESGVPAPAPQATVPAQRGPAAVESTDVDDDDPWETGS